MQSRRYIILGGGALVVLLVLLIFTLGKKVTGGSYESTCNKFIGYIIAQDAAKSYDLFSAGPQRSLTREDWKLKMQAMQPSHFKATYSLVSTNDLTPPKQGGTKPTPRFQLNYLVKSPPIEADTSCYVIKASDGYKIDGYTMSPHDAGTAQ
jgi:hypothetical protein